MKFLLPAILLTCVPLFAHAQAPSQKVLVLRHEKTGKEDTIKLGSFIKLWFWSEQKRIMEQPLTRIDFRKHTYYIESNLMGATDSTLIFLKRSPFLPVPPIPLPIPLPVRIPTKIPMHDFDTVLISEIRGIRLVNPNIEGAVIGVTMVPAMSAMPEYFTTWPGMMFMQPGMQLTTGYMTSVIFPLHKVNRQRNRFTLRTTEIPLDTVYFIQKRKMVNEDDYEWEIERIQRYEKMYAHTKKVMNDRLLDSYQGNSIFSIPLGVTLIPGAFRSAPDNLTRISITDRSFYFGVSTENFITDRHRMGTEITLNRSEPFMSITGGVTASMGMILANFTYLKWGLNGLYSQQYKNRQWAAIHDLDRRIDKETDEIDLGYLESRRSYLRTLLAAEPKPYLLIGVGAVNTTLIKIKGSQASGIGSTDYSQKKMAVEAGFGLFTRVSRRLTYDLSAKYIWSPKYSPYIGGLERYSGFRVQLNVGYMSGFGFMRNRKMLKQVNTNRDK
jgi:hypothetical protein